MSAKNLFPGVKRLTDLVITHAKGCEVFAGSARYLDFTSGIAVTSTGHCHPTVVKAVQEQAAKLVHGQMGIVCHDPMFQLIDKLRPVVPWADSFFFTNSGAEANEAAMRLARHATEKPNIIAMQGGYHGRTVGTLAVTTSGTGYRGKGLGPSPPGNFFAPFPYASQLENVHPDKLTEFCLDQMEMVLKQQSQPTETAAVLIEPVLGEGGYVAPPDDFLPALRDFCDHHDLLLIADEVQSGFGRTGKMFAIEHWDVEPDILIMAKGIASGYPLSGIATRSELSGKQLPGCMGGTYGGNAVACAAAVATMAVFEQEGLLANVAEREQQLNEGLKKLKGQGFPVQEVRSKGLMVAVEFDRAQVSTGFAGALCKQSFENGMLMLPTSIFETVRLMPALTVTEAECAEALDIFQRSLAAVYDEQKVAEVA